MKGVESGTGEKIGEYAFIEISKGQLEAVTAEQYKDFAETVVKDSGYNWVAIICDDGTGICFPGAELDEERTRLQAVMGADTFERVRAIIEAQPARKRAAFLYYVAQYGKQDTDGGILEVAGTITLDENGGYTYEPGE